MKSSTSLKIVRLQATDSTNTWAAEHAGEFSSPALVYCHTQNSGRGQRGNSWESEPGKNITASLLFYPEDFPASLQFAISEAIALAIVGFLSDMGVEARIKWPNDIYVGDKKICGILIEHVVEGKNVTRTIAGFGINLNQTHFLSDAPNPVSLRQLTDREYSIEESMERLAAILEITIEQLRKDPGAFHELFLKRLWRYDGCFHLFRDVKTKEEFKALIKKVDRDGILSLQTRQGHERRYFFKEVEHIL
ncbi:MAG: biotin--[acetyl-CoA-carboxylase] ligase [Muribaculaceae bacterium]|nr:biotin--[acetyl-CoA-carboxylase] ligase [Muribaculaceae bacterium]